MASNSSKKGTGEGKKKRVPLLDDESDDFTPECMQALEEIFARFDKDGDGLLSDTELDAFATACNGRPFDKAAKEEIKTYFDVDESKGGWLKKKGFIEMYHTQTAAEDTETWKDLLKLGYNEQLKLTQPSK